MATTSTKENDGALRAFMSCVDLPFPKYSAIRDEDCAPGFRSLCEDVLHPAIDAFEKDVSRHDYHYGRGWWEGVWNPYQRIIDRLQRAFDVVEHLNTVRSSDALENGLREMQEVKTGVLLRLGTSDATRKAFAKLEQLLRDDKATDCEKTKKLRERLFKRRIEEMRQLSTSSYSKDDDGGNERSLRLQQIALELSEQRRIYGENLTKAALGFAYHVRSDEPEKIAGVPEAIVKAAAASAAKKEGEGWTFGLSHWPVLMMHADHPSTREGMGRARMEMARDNLPVVLSMLRLRHEQSRLLGFVSFADMVCGKRMAQSVKAVESFLDTLRADLMPHAKREIEELEKRFVEEDRQDRQSPISTLETLLSYPHAMFYKNKLLEENTGGTDDANDANDDKTGFVIADLVSRLDSTARKLFGVRLVRELDVEGACAWHPSVEVFAVVDEKDDDDPERAAGRVMGHVCFDLRKREGKSQVAPAWVAKAQSRSRLFLEHAQHPPCDEKTKKDERLPLVHVCANLEDGEGGADATSTRCVFHEFGHALHYVLSEAEDDSCGYEGIEWDAVEIPSYFMERWGAKEEGDALDTLPVSSAIDTLRQVQFALADLTLHSCAPPTTEKEMTNVLRDIARSTLYASVPEAFRPEEAYYPCFFSHLFTGEYAASYYGYLWSSNLAADAYAHVVQDPETRGRDFRREFLAYGSGRHPMDGFRAFLGREPDDRALLREF